MTRKRVIRTASTEAPQWVAYIGKHKHVVIRLASEARPLVVVDTRKATPTEVVNELQRRAFRVAQAELEQAFRDRQAVKDARVIANTIEFMERGDGTIDRLTPTEWAELRRRLTV